MAVTQKVGWAIEHGDNSDAREQNSYLKLENGKASWTARLEESTKFNTEEAAQQAAEEWGCGKVTLTEVYG